MANHMKEHLIGKMVSDIEPISSMDVFGEVHTGMEITFSDGTRLTTFIETDDELNDRTNLGWKITTDICEKKEDKEIIEMQQEEIDRLNKKITALIKMI